MGKKAREKRERRQSEILAEATSNRPLVHPNATLGPEASLEGTYAHWARTATAVAPIGVPDDDGEVEERSSGWVQLTDRFLQGRFRLHPRSLIAILTLVWAVFLGWVFVQDNGAGRLDQWEGLRWFGVKVGMMSGVAVVVMAAVSLLLFWKQRD